MYAKYAPRKRSKLFVAAALGLFPLSAFAGTSITEIMYDAPGADTGHEWIEVQNVGDSPIDTRSWKLSEGGVNHKIIAQRSSVLSPGEYGIIAQNATKFSSDHPGYAGALFQSAFSLNNTGETFALKDSSSDTASAVYDASTGAGGDGNTLNFIHGAWVPRAPSPGSPASGSALVPSAKPTVRVGNSQSAGKVSQKGQTETGVSSGYDSSEAPLAAAASGAQGASSGIFPWLAALGVVAMAGVGAIFFTKAPPAKRADEYTIIEDK